jgi:transposase
MEPCWRRQLAWIGRALSPDLRDHVVTAIEGGLSCRQAAERFGVSTTTAIRWRPQLLAHGTPAGKVRGGDRRTAKIEDRAAFMPGTIRQQPDSTLSELRGMLAERA